MNALEATILAAKETCKPAYHAAVANADMIFANYVMFFLRYDPLMEKAWKFEISFLGDASSNMKVSVADCDFLSKGHMSRIRLKGDGFFLEVVCYDETEAAAPAA